MAKHPTDWGDGSQTFETTTDTGETVKLSDYPWAESDPVFLPNGQHPRLHDASVWLP